MVPFKVVGPRKLKAFLLRVFEEEHREVRHISYTFCSDEYLLDINKTYLKKDYLTDIITFDVSVDSQIMADIYISIDRVRENAPLYERDITSALHRVMIHGLLHLAGYKDKKKSEIYLMRGREEHYLRLLDKIIHEAR